MKNRIRLTESQLHRVIKESVRRVIKEGKENGSLVINGTPIQVEVGHSLQEWKETYDDGNNWDVSFEDLITGAIEPSENATYWLINGRLFETNETDWA